MSRPQKEPTTTCLVYEALREADDFLTAQRLAKLTGRTSHQIWSTLIHLRIRRAVDCIVNGDGHSYWFITPETDNRFRHIDARIIETKPRKNRKRKEKQNASQG